MATSKIIVNFTAPSGTTSNYLIKYKPTTSSTWTEVSVSGTPPFTVFESADSAITYDVEVYQECPGGVLSLPDTDISESCQCNSYTFENTTGADATITYTPCGLSETTRTLAPLEIFTDCIAQQCDGIEFPIDGADCAVTQGASCIDIHATIT